MDKLSLVREFWDETPCDGQPTYALRSQLRYQKEPWLLPLIDRIANAYPSILEVGCGQGTDGVTLCERMPPGGRYVGVDMSEVSLARARSAAAEIRERLQVTPHFGFENAEQLSFADNSFPCILSVGALHHSENTERAIAEVRRVLAPGGTAFILLYRTIAPKVFTAHLLRAVQRSLDAVLRTDRILYRALRAVRREEGAGTAVYECFGVPILRSYTRASMCALFRDFSSLTLTAHGSGRSLARLGNDPLGYLWLAEATK
jgi:SAM-dependent methyltransferase